MSENSELQRELYELLSELKLERSSFDAHWREIADNMLPRRVRFTTSNRNRGDKRNQLIKDETPLFAARTLKAGMMGGVTSPARVWFQLATSDPEFKDDSSVKNWLHQVTNILSSVFLRSNLYHALPVLYGDFGVFGTGAMGIEEDFNGSVFRAMTFPVGSYYISQNDKMQVNIFAREFELTVRQVVNKFAIVNKEGKVTSDNISTNVKNLWENNTRDTWVKLLHIVRPNDEYDPEDPFSMEFESIYVEEGTVGSGAGTSASDDTILRRRGYSYFPVLVPRWEVAGEDIYGTNCPGMEALPAVKQLHKMETRGIQAVEKMVNPPMQAPTTLIDRKVSLLPGDVTYIDTRQGSAGFTPLYQIDFNIGAHEAKTEQTRNRVRKAFFEDLFLMFQALEQRDRVTAAEINARREEKLLVLGPVLERLNQDLLDPLIDIGFDIAVRQGLIPEPPQILKGKDLKVEYISIMHQAQKSTGLAAIDRLKMNAAELAQIDPEALDKYNFDAITDEYADTLGTPPHLLNDTATVQKIREDRARQQAELQQKEEMMQQAELATKINITPEEAPV